MINLQWTEEKPSVFTVFNKNSNKVSSNNSNNTTMVRRHVQKTLLKAFIVIWALVSMAYLIIYQAPKGTNKKLPDDTTTLSDMTHGQGQTALPKANETVLRVENPWTCEQLNGEINKQSGGFRFHSKDPLKSTATSYCLGMMESFQRCIGFVQHSENPEHLLPNPYLAYSYSLATFREKLRKYQSAHIYFVHVMKSSGTSIEGVLRRHQQYDFGGVKLLFKNVFSYFCSNMLMFYRLSEAEPEHRFISMDKRSYGLHRMVKSPGYYVTILRNPVDRFVSMYYYIKQGKYPTSLEDQLFNDVFQSKDLDEFLRNTKGKQIPFFDNHSIRMFQFDHYPDVFSTFSGGPDTYIKDVTKLVQINESHYNEALINLRNCAFVGITEKFKESQQMLETILGLETSKKEVSINVNRNYERDAITLEQREAIEARVVYDMKLYNEAKLIFKDQYNAFRRLFADTQ